MALPGATLAFGGKPHPNPNPDPSPNPNPDPNPTPNPNPSPSQVPVLTGSLDDVPDGPPSECLEAAEGECGPLKGTLGLG